MSARAVLTLALLAGCFEQKPQVVAEFEKRSTFVRQLSEQENKLSGWALNSRHNLVFEDGMSNPMFHDVDAPEPAFFEVRRLAEVVPGTLVRWMNKNVHFRARGDTDMVFAMRGMINLKQVFTQPRLELFIDGELVASQLVGADGRFDVRANVAQATAAEWIDIYAVFSSLQEPERAPGEPFFARLEWVDWEPANTRAGQP